MSRLAEAFLAVATTAPCVVACGPSVAAGDGRTSGGPGATASTTGEPPAMGSTSSGSSSTEAGSSGGIEATTTGEFVDACGPFDGAESFVSFNPPAAVDIGFGGSVEVECLLRANSTPDKAKLNCDDGVGRFTVRGDLPGLDFTRLPTELHALASWGGFESGGHGAIGLSSTGPDSKLLLLDLRGERDWVGPRDWLPWLSRLTFDYSASDCGPYTPSWAGEEVTCVRGSMEISGRQSSIVVGDEPTAMLEEWLVFVRSVQVCDSPFFPIGAGVGILIVHESLMR